MKGINGAVSESKGDYNMTMIPLESSFIYAT
jgi:hypothetical protein